jgi:hypothetical protein
MCEWLAGSGHSPSVVVLNHGDEAARTGMEARVQSVVSSSVAKPALSQTINLA